MDKMNSFDNDKLFNNDNLEEKNRLSHFSPVLLKKKGTKLVFLYKGQRYAVDTESEESRENCKEILNNLDSEHTFVWFKEETGNKQWVLYDTKYFYIQKKIEVLLLKTLTKKMAKSLHGLKKGLACSIMCSMIQKCSATV